MATSSTFTVTRSIRVDAPPAAVRGWVVGLHRWQAWSPWEDLDPQLQRSYGGPDVGVGARYEWSGNRKAGQGRMEIVDADEAGVTIDLRFLKPFRSRSTTAFRFEPASGGSDVTWTMTGPKTGMTRVTGIFTSMDEMIGPDFEKGRGGLKVAAETEADRAG